MSDVPTAPSCPGVQITSADLFQMSGEVAADLLQGVDALLLISGPEVLGRLKPPAADEPTLGFRIPVDRRGVLREGDELQLVATKGGEQVLLGSAPVQTRLAGALDRCNEGLVRGWAANLNCPDLPLEVEILLNGVSQGFAVANRSRSDLQRLDRSVAATGFLFRFSPPLNVSAPGPAEVTARIRGTGIALANSPWWVRRSYDALPELTPQFA